YFLPPQGPGPGTRAEAAAEVRRLLEHAVEARLEPGATTLMHLSGGLDSSSMVAVAGALQGRAARSTRPEVRLFSAVYPGLDCDESGFIDAVAAVVPFPGERCDGTRFDAALPTPPPSHPFADMVPLGDLAAAARAGARVVLSGMGGDELFFE